MKTKIHVEQLGIDFGLQNGTVCTSCGDEFISDEVWEKIEKKTKKLGLFGLEKKVKIRKSGNSLVVTSPPEIAKFIGAKTQTLVSLLPLGKGRLEIQLLD